MHKPQDEKRPYTHVLYYLGLTRGEVGADQGKAKKFMQPNLHYHFPPYGAKYWKEIFSRASYELSDIRRAELYGN